MVAGVRCVLMGFILCSSVPGLKAAGQVRSVCALKGSSVDLPCASENSTPSLKWYVIYSNDTLTALTEFPANGMFTTSEESGVTLTISSLQESDARAYCCTEAGSPEQSCWLRRTELSVADLQVKVIPAAEGPAVWLMCSSSCRLDEAPAAHMWYRNGEFLYEDSSPWYQELVSSDAAVSYSCAIKGYEGLRTPEVSVDSVTSACFKVTYAKGSMCSQQKTSEDEPCTIIFPREIHVKISQEPTFSTLTCDSSCLAAGPQIAYRWYWEGEPHMHCESRDVVVIGADSNVVSCGIKGHEDLLSDEVCTGKDGCRLVNYVSRRICALEGSSLDISTKLSPRLVPPNADTWYKISGPGEVTDILQNRVEFYSIKNERHIIQIHDVKKNDSATYSFVRMSRKNVHLTGVLLVVTGLKVTMTPSAVVTEGQRVTLTCTTSCPVASDVIYVWYVGGEPLTPPVTRSKHLRLDPVTVEDTGKYFCAVQSAQSISSAEETLTVLARGRLTLIMNAGRVVVLVLLLTVPPLLYLWMRKKKNLTSTAKRGTSQVELPYENIALRPVSRAAQAEQELRDKETPPPHKNPC